LLNVAITGGAGYVGSALVPYLLKTGEINKITVLDTFWFGDRLPDDARVEKIEGDIRDKNALDRAFKGANVALHLACVSNDPSFELNSSFGKSVNYDSFDGIVQAAEDAGVQRFIYASSSSVYGIQDGDVTEKTICKPLTGYSRYKYLCEMKLQTKGFSTGTWTILRPATVCGYAPRLRLDLVVNAMTASALFKRKVTVNGGAQLRPNINIKDMVRAYAEVIKPERWRMAAEKIYNVGYENLSLNGIASLVKHTIEVVEESSVAIEATPTNDERSYHVNSKLFQTEMGFEPSYTIQSAIASLASAKALHLFKGMEDSKYYNIARMKEFLSESAV